MIMAETMSLMDFLRNLLTDSGLRDQFAANPQGALAEHGLSNLSPADVHDALVLCQDTQTADFHRSYDTGHNSIANSVVASPPPLPHHDYTSPATSHQAAVDYLNNYVTNNYIDNRSTTVDNSTNQQIDTHGGNFDQNIDVHSTVASGDGAVAAGGSINHSTVTTGHDNQIGDGNVRGNGNVVGDHNQAVTGSHDTTSFGSGAATTTDVGGNVNVGAGGAFGSGGAATVNNSDHSLHNVGNTATDNSINGSFHNSSDHSVHDSGNTHLDASTHNSHNDDSTHATDSSFTDSSDHHQQIDNSHHDVGNTELHPLV